MYVLTSGLNNRLIDDGARSHSTPVTRTTTTTTFTTDVVVRDASSLFLIQYILLVAVTFFAFRALCKFRYAMEVDQPMPPPTPSDTPAAFDDYLPVEAVNVEGETMLVRRPVKAQPPDTLALPESYRDGVFYVMYQNVTGLRRADLVDLCKGYQLGVNENMKMLRERLVGFSENLVRWKIVVPGAKRAHRGVRDGMVKKNEAKKDSKHKKPKEKLSMLRRNDLMGISPSDSQGQTSFVVQRSKDMRTLEEKNDLVRWAKEYIKKHPYIPPDERDRLVKTETDAKASDPAAINGQLQETNKRIDGLTSMIGTLVQSWPTNVAGSNAPGLVLSTPPPPLLTSSVPAPTLPLPVAMPLIAAPLHVAGHLPSLPASPAPTQPPSLQNTTDPSSVNNLYPQADVVSKTGNESAASEERSFVLRIAHGQTFSFKLSDVRVPDQLTFAPDIPRLDRVWDDEGPNWDPIDCGTNILSIKGIPIALRYWPDVFSRKKDKRWQALKSTWTEWKWVAERYRLSGPDAFKKEFDSCTWQQICNQLRHERERRNNELVERAKAEYGDQFAEVFSNRKKVMVDINAIANRYLMLKGSTD
ncbi:hypothetical protein F5878DRAFT_631192 [Lentinula raphanica]|uniref:Uncharacterized protein n=1 Tax=Lentinula raphanica TaxID=153919 RepID=A0AA38P0S5_9AGAR|nr:hypothetical protein F5878DRAFT_631192 [Lentinula raphanica]